MMFWFWMKPLTYRSVLGQTPGWVLVGILTRCKIYPNICKQSLLCYYFRLQVQASESIPTCNLYKKVPLKEQTEEPYVAVVNTLIS